MSGSEQAIDPALVRELAAILREGDLGEIEIEYGELKIRVAKATAAAPQPVTYQMPSQMPAMVPGPNEASAPSSAAPAGNAARSDAIPAPMVGTVYLSPEPGADTFVKIGDTVSKGETLMLVEAMKTYNPVSAPSDGTVKEILVTDGQPVEYGEPLIVIA